MMMPEAGGGLQHVILPGWLGNRSSISSLWCWRKFIRDRVVT